MGKFPKAMFGAFRGRVGALVGGKWKDAETLRTRPEGGTSNPTDLQLQQRAKFGMTMRFMSAIKIVLDDIYRKYPQKMTAVNKAVSEVLKFAIVGEYPDLSFDYSKVIVAKGELPNANNPTATAEAADSIKFAWTDNSGSNNAKSSDRAIVVVYCEELNQYNYSLNSGTRGQNTATFAVPGFSGKTVHTWLSFLSENGKAVATSVYTGSVVVVK